MYQIKSDISIVKTLARYASFIVSPLPEMVYIDRRDNKKRAKSKSFSHSRMIIGEFSRYSSGQAMWQLKNNYKHMKEIFYEALVEKFDRKNYLVEVKA